MVSGQIVRLCSNLLMRLITRRSKEYWKCPGSRTYEEPQHDEQSILNRVDHNLVEIFYSTRYLWTDYQKVSRSSSWNFP